MLRSILLTSRKNLKENFFIGLSAIAGLCLFLTPSLLNLIGLFLTFWLIVIISLLKPIKKISLKNRYIQLSAFIVTFFILFQKYQKFITVWLPSSKIKFLANLLHLSSENFLKIFAFLGCAVGAYAVYILITTFLYSLTLIKNLSLYNLKNNWYFPFSAFAFFYLNVPLQDKYLTGLLLAFFMSLILAAKIPCIWEIVKNTSLSIRIISALTALGVCWQGQTLFNDRTYFFSNWHIDVAGLASLWVVSAIFFVYLALLFFWKNILDMLRATSLFKEISLKERVAYVVLILMSIIFVIVIFSNTQVFYGTDYNYDIIYTSDSSALVKGNVYLTLNHGENDLRQPLFAVFSAPFIGLPYFIGKFLGLSATLRAILINLVQVFLLFIGNFMLAKSMKLNALKRVCFMLLNCLTYTYLLSILMMEQYIIAFFWLALCIYLISENYLSNRIAVWGAGGALLPSLFFVLFMSDYSPLREVKNWLKDMLKYGVEFFFIMIFFCRFNVIATLSTKVNSLMGFTGRHLTLKEKFYQYISFIKNCFFAPDAEVDFTKFSHVSWQLNPVEALNAIGILIFCLVLVSAFLNRKKKSSQLAICWVGCSVLMLCILGWGTAENGLILYALYYSWAFFVLLFQLVEYFENKLNVNFIVPIITGISRLVVIGINFTGIAKMINFGITYYPV